jgi:hypothetical protein
MDLYSAPETLCWVVIKRNKNGTVVYHPQRSSRDMKCAPCVLMVRAEEKRKRCVFVYTQLLLLLLLLCEWLYCVFALCVPLPLHDKYICFSRTIASGAARRDFCAGGIDILPEGVTRNAAHSMVKHYCIAFQCQI